MTDVKIGNGTDKTMKKDLLYNKINLDTFFSYQSVNQVKSLFQKHSIINLLLLT